MPVFEYKAYKEDGGVAAGVIDAESPKEARGKLKGKKLFAFELKEIGADAAGGAGKVKPVRTFFVRRNTQELALVTRQLATMLSSGIQIVPALSAIIDQCEDRRLKSIMLDVRDRVTKGNSFSEALEPHRAYFSDLYVNMVKAGEASGELDKITDRLSEYLLRSHKMQSKIIAALTYPAILVIISICVVIFLLTFVVPKIMTVLEKHAKTLPLPTEILLTVSFILGKTWPFLIIALIAGWFAFRKIRATEQGRLATDTFVLKIPVIGTMMRKAVIARFTTTLSVLLESGVSMVGALNVASNVVGNTLIGNTIREAASKISEGSDVSTPFRNSKIFPPVVVYMISIGEESGQLPQLLRKISETYESELEIESQRLVSILEPALILTMTVVVVFIVLSILLPVMQMARVAR